MIEPRRLAAAISTAALVIAVGCHGDSATDDAKKTAGGGDAARGEQQYAVVCATCHGPDGHGVKGLGKDLVTSEFVRKASDDQIAKLIVDGRDAHDPANTTGVAMPPRGGNPGLSDKDVRDIVAYLRTINK